uniref:GLIPR1-like protein 2-like n=1 Tax=Saccoglossus kowalevskii TaxID=10224 RepID=A0ABM0MTB5_SACKO|nr:PREDICTED: GLIPR1-like protein 2-like [Saccoglossus kowalevskii]
MIVNIHNNFRRNAGMHCGIEDGLVFMDKLIWDTYLELKARDFATCYNITNNRAINLDIYDDFFGEVNPQVSGWNLAFGHDMSVENLIESWFKQADVYSCEWETCKPQNERCEDFLQLVWSEASRVGCSVNPSCIHDGESGIFLVCYYDKGWTPFKPPFQIGNKCSQCDNGYGFCEDGLCECKKSCHHPGIGVLHRETCTCACIFGMGHDCEGESYVDFLPALRQNIKRFAD